MVRVGLVVLEVVVPVHSLSPLLPPLRPLLRFAIRPQDSEQVQFLGFFLFQILGLDELFEVFEEPLVESRHQVQSRLLLVLVGPPLVAFGLLVVVSRRAALGALVLQFHLLAEGPLHELLGEVLAGLEALLEGLQQLVRQVQLVGVQVVLVPENREPELLLFDVLLQVRLLELEAQQLAVDLLATVLSDLRVQRLEVLDVFHEVGTSLQLRYHLVQNLVLLDLDFAGSELQTRRHHLAHLRRLLHSRAHVRDELAQQVRERLALLGALPQLLTEQLDQAEVARVQPLEDLVEQLERARVLVGDAIAQEEHQQRVLEQVSEDLQRVGGGRVAHLELGPEVLLEERHVLVQFDLDALLLLVDHVEEALAEHEVVHDPFLEQGEGLRVALALLLVNGHQDFDEQLVLVLLGDFLEEQLELQIAAVVQHELVKGLPLFLVLHEARLALDHQLQERVEAPQHLEVALQSRLELAERVLPLLHFGLLLPFHLHLHNLDQLSLQLRQLRFLVRLVRVREEALVAAVPQ